MNKTFAGLSLLLLVSLVFSGCVQSQTPENTTVPINTVSAPTAESVVDELAGGTGTGSNDITPDDLDTLQNDLDELDVSVDELSQSDI